MNINSTLHNDEKKNKKINRPNEVTAPKGLKNDFLMVSTITIKPITWVYLFNVILHVCSSTTPYTIFNSGFQ